MCLRAERARRGAQEPVGPGPHRDACGDPHPTSPLTVLDEREPPVVVDLDSRSRSGRCSATVADRTEAHARRARGLREPPSAARMSCRRRWCATSRSVAGSTSRRQLRACGGLIIIAGVSPMTGHFQPQERLHRTIGHLAHCRSVWSASESSPRAGARVQHESSTTARVAAEYRAVPSASTWCGRSSPARATTQQRGARADHRECREVERGLVSSAASTAATSVASAGSSPAEDCGGDAVGSVSMCGG